MWEYLKTFNQEIKYLFDFRVFKYVRVLAFDRELSTRGSKITTPTLLLRSLLLSFQDPTWQVKQRLPSLQPASFSATTTQNTATNV